MPVKIDRNSPAFQDLTDENVFVLPDDVAIHQQIRPQRILILNLMPRKLVTENQLLRLLSNSPLQVEIDFLYMKSHQSKNTSSSHLTSFYKTFDQIKSEFYDALIITGAPIENIPFEAVDYWSELTNLLNWAETHVFSTLYICWGAQAGLYAKYGFDKVPLAKKLSGIYENSVENPKHPLFRGFDDSFFCPHSRYTETILPNLTADFEILSQSDESGISMLCKKNYREIYLFGHLEYDRETLNFEYQRDLTAGKNPEIPEHYFPDENPSNQPRMRWRESSFLFFGNWLNLIYQETFYDLSNLTRKREETVT